MSILRVGAVTEDAELLFVVCLKEGKPCIDCAISEEMQVAPSERSRTTNVDGDTICVIN
jgi:hypothetical protein